MWQSGRADGFGYVLSEEDPYVGVDLDGCRNAETGVLDEMARVEIERFSSYTESSPSGTGIRIFCLGELPEGGNRHGKFEIYDHARFLTMTGIPVPGYENLTIIESRQSAIEQFHTVRIAKSGIGVARSPTKAKSAVSSQPDTSALKPFVRRKITDLCRRDARFDDRWSRSQKGPNQKDNSPNGWCLSVANSLVSRSWPDGEVVEALKLYRTFHGDPDHHNEKWYWNAVEEAKRWLTEHASDEKPVEPIPDSVHIAALRHRVCLRNLPEAFSQFIDLVLESRDSGRTAQLENEQLAALFEVSESTVTRRTNFIKDAGCASVRAPGDGTHRQVYDLHIHEFPHPRRVANLQPDEDSLG